MDKLTQEQLMSLYLQFVVYRDRDCGGRANMSIERFYNELWDPS